MENYKVLDESTDKRDSLIHQSISMRILAAFDKFKDSFSAEEACELVEKTAKEASQDIDIISCPLTDGGEGFAEILTNRHKGVLVDVEAREIHLVYIKSYHWFC